MPNITIELLNRENPQHQIEVSNTLLEIMSNYYQKYYPDFKEWYKDKTIPGFLNGTRDIYIARDISQKTIKGVVILKKATALGQRNKISSILILPEITKHGFGTKMLRLALNKAKGNTFSNQIVITVPEEKVISEDHSQNLATFLEQHGFILIETIPNRYRSNKKEYVFMQELDSIK